MGRAPFGTVLTTASYPLVRATYSPFETDASLHRDTGKTNAGQYEGLSTDYADYTERISHEKAQKSQKVFRC